MKAAEVIAHLEHTADPSFAASWDRSGLQVTASRERVQSLAVTLDPTPERIQRALAAGADFILTHHPLALQPELPARETAYTAALRLLFQGDAWLYAAHTSLDVCTHGPPAWLAQSLGLHGLAPVLPVQHEAVEGRQGQADPVRGFGILGDLAPPLPWEALAGRLAAEAGLDRWTEVGPRPGPVSRLAYCPGSGMDLAGLAFAQGAQVYLSGDLKYHQAQELEPLGLTLDLGHFALEERMMAAWARELAAALQDRDIRVEFIPGHNPMRSVSLLEWQRVKEDES